MGMEHSGCYTANNIFKLIFWYQNWCILIQIHWSLSLPTEVKIGKHAFLSQELLLGLCFKNLDDRLQKHRTTFPRKPLYIGIYLMGFRQVRNEIMERSSLIQEDGHRLVQLLSDCKNTDTIRHFQFVLPNPFVYRCTYDFILLPDLFVYVHIIFQCFCIYSYCFQFLPKNLLLELLNW